MKRGPNRWGWRLLRISAAVLAVMAGAAAYGFLVHARRIFPYEVVRRARHGQRETTHSPHGWHAKRAGAPSPLELVQQLTNLPYLQGYRPATPSRVIRRKDGRTCSGAVTRRRGRSTINRREIGVRSTAGIAM